MLVLDTNVLSEMMRTRPDQPVADWILAQPSETLFTAAVCQAEILSGIAVLPAGRRRSHLAETASAVFTEDFEGRVLAFDSAASAAYAEMFAERRKTGRPTGTIDLMVAAVARVWGAGIVTRNVGDFSGFGLTVINPWDD